MNVVLKSDVSSLISGEHKVRVLCKANIDPFVWLSAGQTCKLVVTRHGNCESLNISRRVAEELISAGFAHGD